MFALSLLADLYPQRRDWQDRSWLDRQSERLRTWLQARLGLSSWRLNRFVRQVDAAQPAVDALTEPELQALTAELQLLLRRDGLQDRHVAPAFALVRRRAGELLGKRHFPTQLKGGYILLQGFLLEMDTGEGKTLTATLAAAVAAMAGRKVHVVTVNDYLAERDVMLMAPLYHALGLSTGLVREDMKPDEKKPGYLADIVYCSNKSVVFDYLRDRLALADKMSPMQLALGRLSGRSAANILLPGLQFAIVDEADSVFIDEARTPLIISASRPGSESEAYYRQAIELARALQPGVHFEQAGPGSQPHLQGAGRDELARLAAHLPPVWQARNRREEVVGMALMACHGLRRDIDYIVREGKVLIVDENTGRTMADRSWERGLHQMVEVKEGLPPGDERETLGKISYQLFFRRYLVLSGMTGTCREVAGELGEVYGLGVVRVPPYRRSRRRYLGARLFATSAQRWAAVIASVQQIQQSGRPVLIGTRSIKASEVLSQCLQQAGIAHRVLNAKQDAEEAEVVASAGAAGAVTIATNMAGRGTDVLLDEEVKMKGGLHVILTERHDNARVDRQLIGRCARQGDPGSYEIILSLEDDLVVQFVAKFNVILSRLLQTTNQPLIGSAGLLYYRAAQRYMEWQHRRLRQHMLSADFRARQALSFSGQSE